jgi:hypothetical protein
MMTDGHGAPGAGRHLDDLRVGQHIVVQGERQDDATLVAARVHVPKP